jgi:hypothetical protein
VQMGCIELLSALASHRRPQRKTEIAWHGLVKLSISGLV